MTEKYIKLLSMYLDELRKEESNLNEAAKLMADAVRNDRLIHIFGTDPRSASIGDELLCKGGGLVNINPLYDPAFSFAHGGYRCSLCQSLYGLAPIIMEYYENIREGDPIIIIGSRPDNLVLTQAVEKAIDMKLRVIVVTSMEGSAVEWASRVDVIIDNHAPEKDCVITCGDVATAGVSTILTGAVLNLLEVKTIELAPGAPVWSGSRYMVSHLSGGLNYLKE